jgi:hypothetical protein
MSVTTESIFTALQKSTLGYSYGKPKRVGEKSLTVVLPILRETTLKRQYTTFPETDKVHVFDTGRIDEMEADNQSGENVFMRSGTLFRGATQERALQRSMVLFTGKRVKMPVRCIHRSRGISPGSKVKYGGITPLSFDASNYSDGYKFADQGSTWSNVENYTSSIGPKHAKPRAGASMRMHSSHGHGQAMNMMKKGLTSSSMPIGDTEEVMIGADQAAIQGAWSGSDDLASAIDGLSKGLDDVLSKIKCDENQAGLALITDTGVSTVEVFDHKDSWRALHESAVKRMGKELVTEDPSSVFEYKPEHAAKAVNQVLALDYKQNVIYDHRPSNGEPAVRVMGLTAKGYVGEIVEINEQLIHLVLLKTA